MSGQVIIIEGPDGSGKTTLAQSLARIYNATYVHQGPYGDDPFLEALLTVYNRPGPIVLDRAHIGEQVYGPLYRGGDMLGHARRRMLERYLLARQAVVVSCEPPYPTCEANWQAGRERGEEMFDDAARHYIEWAKFTSIQSTAQTPATAIMTDAVRTELPLVAYNYTTDSLNDLLTRLVNARTPWNGGPGVGCFEQGTVLLVGGRPSRRTKPFTFPFIAREGTSPWLAALFEQWGVPEADLYWINAMTPDGLETDGRFAGLLWPSRVVAMGDEAQRWAKRRDWPGGTNLVHVPDPGEWRRYHDDFTPLQEALT